jgi:hypothetical protein
LIVHGERPVAEQTKARKDVLQAAGLIEYFQSQGMADVFNAAWRDALCRGPGRHARSRDKKPCCAWRRNS